MCDCCYCDYDRKEAVLLEDCGHVLCDECYGAYLDSKVQAGPDCVFAVCPDMECNLVVPERIFKKLLTKEKFERYKFFVLKSFVDFSKKTKWCPGRNCQMACESKYGEPIDVDCTCGTSFCFSCTKSAHKPMDCDLLQKWLDRISQGDEDTSNWIKLNTKNCPKCKASIQKNQGCMHMTCSQCKYGFCWLCLGDYKDHMKETGRGLCNSYADVVAAGRGASEKELTN